MEEEAVAVRAEHKRNVEDLGIDEGLLHARSDRVAVVLRLEEGDRQVGRVEEQVVNALALASGDELAAHDDVAVSEPELPPPSVRRPPGLGDRRRDEAVTDV